MAYKLTSDGCVIRIEDGATIPPDSGNTDYASYLEWKAAGGVPESLAAAPVIPSYAGFYDALLTSAAYQKIRLQAQKSLPLTLVAVEFVAAITDAKAGRANVPALQNCLINIVATATDLTPFDWAEIGVLLEENNLSGVYQLPRSSPPA